MMRASKLEKYCALHDLRYLCECPECQPGCFRAPEGTTHVVLPLGAGEVRALLVVREELYVAFQFGVYKRSGDTWEPVLTVPGHT